MIESPVFPLCVSFNQLFGPAFNTDLVVVESGDQYANRNWEQPLQRGKVSFDARVAADMAIVRKWIYNTAGAAEPFRIRDATDYQAPDRAGIGTLSLVSGSVYQMYKTYVLGGSTLFRRKIIKPEVGATELYDNLTLKLLTTHYTIDESTGLITISFTPAGTLSWRGTFHVPVRFVSDLHQFELLNKSSSNGFIEGIQELEVQEVRNPF